MADISLTDYLNMVDISLTDYLNMADISLTDYLNMADTSLIDHGMFDLLLLFAVHIMLRLFSCLPTAFYPLHNQSFLMPIFSHAMKPNYSTVSLLVFVCLSSPPIFLLTRHIQGLLLSSHDQRMWIDFS
ncbi:hypothetical protein BsWGS_22863 [Bradybaena similaris]